MGDYTTHLYGSYNKLGGGFNDFLFSPRTLGKWSNLTCAYFSDGLVQPPISKPWNKDPYENNQDSMESTAGFLSWLNCLYQGYEMYNSEHYVDRKFLGGCWVVGICNVRYKGNCRFSSCIDFEFCTYPPEV